MLVQICRNARTINSLATALPAIYNCSSSCLDYPLIHQRNYCRISRFDMTTNDRQLLLLLGGAAAQQGMRCIQQARSRGWKVWLTDTPDNLAHAPDVVAVADQVTPLPYEAVEDCVTWATEQAQTEPFVGVFGFREYSVESVAAVSRALGLPGNPPEIVRSVRHKPSCRQLLRERGFRQPLGQLCTDLDTARGFAAAHPPGPWIVKPPAAMSSQGVSLVRDAADWQYALANLGDRGNSPFLVECFQSGEEFSAEGLFVYGQPYVLTLTAKITTGAPHFIELGHTMPADLDAATTRIVTETVTSALRSLSLTWGIFHVEFWLEDKQPVLGEVHVRPGGDCINLMTELVTGIELYGAVFDQFVRRPLEPSIWQPHCGAAIRYLTPTPGLVSAIEGWDKVLDDPDCRLAQLPLQLGDRIAPVRTSQDRPGFILTVGKTAHQATETAERLCATVRVHTVPYKGVA
jgi:biotin carboxylase